MKLPPHAIIAVATWLLLAAAFLTSIITIILM